MYGGISRRSSSVATNVDVRKSRALPPELWAVIFEYATAVSRFFDARWHYGLLTPFDDAPLDARAAYDSFAMSIATKKAISLVCRGWHQFAAGLMYRHIVIKRTVQLSALVHLFESSRAVAKRLGSSAVGLGWWVTHVKLIAMDYGVATNEPERESDADNRVSMSEGGSFAFYLRRLLACCPRLEVLLDAAPYAIDDRPKPYLYAIRPSSVSSTSRLRSLEYARSGPNLGDLLANPHISQNLRSLKCNTIHTTLTRDTSISLPAVRQILPLSNLVSLDLFLSSTTHQHWDVIAASWSLPSLAHFTFCVPPSSSTVLGTPAHRSMHSFFVSHGHKLASLDIKVCPGDAPLDAYRGLSPSDTATQTTMLIPPILDLCPNITELAISARWIAPHPSPPRSRSSSSTQAQAHAPSFSLRSWRHRNLVRIGLRDTHPSAPGFLKPLANGPCSSCLSYTSPFLHDSEGSRPAAVMSRRLCSIHHFLIMLLSDSSTNGSRNTIISPSIASRRRAFPALTSIHLLDSAPEMFCCNEAPHMFTTCEEAELGVSASHTRTSNSRAATESESTFWSAWARRCAERGVVLYDRGGQRLLLGAMEII